MTEAKFDFLRYTNCWEDTDILLEALDIKEGETGISVASAGDNTLAMLLKSPERIYAFDLNKIQLYCCELKMAAFRCLAYEEMLVLLGVKNGDRGTLYRRVRFLISPEAKKYFDLNPDIIEKGIINTGKFEGYFRIFRKYIIPVISSQERFRKFVCMRDTEKQTAYCRKYIETRRFRAVFRIFFGYRVMGRLGRDSSFYRYVTEKESSGEDIRKRFEYGVSHTSNVTNPYFGYIVFGRYGGRNLPLYLRRENFDIIRRRLDRITLVHGDLLSLDIKNADFANLSDIFEYMSEDDFRKNTEHLGSMLSEGGRAAYWNMQNRRYIEDDGFRYEDCISAKLFEKNKSWFYRDFRLYRRTLTGE